MTTQYAFSFDSTFCSGCKACQAACKDKNNLPTGVLWRRVYEVSGGTWQHDGEAWRNTVFAYNLSMACNHCHHPKCAGVCPVDAFVIRQDGIVLLDTSKCVGCGYCAWACPYGVPQYNPNFGTMTKCDFCFDNLEQGLPPACVAACPMRVLDYRDTSVDQGSGTEELVLWEAHPEEHPYPLPNYSRTQPRLAIKLHPAISTLEKKSVANLEEVRPRMPSGWEDVPLILFTLLGQMAVGSFWALLWTFPFLWVGVDNGTTLMRLLPALLIAICLGAGTLLSFAHLGKKKNAWRVLGHLSRSWLSREILFTGLFGMGWLITTVESVIWRRNTIEWMGISAALGLGLVYSMAQVYRLRSVPSWNTWQTNLGFLVSALLLGQSAMAGMLLYESKITGLQIPSVQWMLIGGILLLLLLIQLLLIGKRFPHPVFHPIRIGLIFVGLALVIVDFILFGSHLLWLSILIFLIIALEEGVGRWLFYQSRSK